MSSFLLEEILEAQSKGYTNLYLNYHHLSEIPQNLLALSKIKRLFLRRNSIKKLPADIWKLEQLLELYLDSNNLQELPEGIGKITLLDTLTVSNNFLKCLTPAVGQLKSLTSLYLANNELSHLPKEFGTLHNLKVLNVVNNKLEWLPWQLCQCASLETLAFDRNAVQVIPHQLMTHTRLKELSASGNRLLSLPQDVNFLMSLESLIVDNNTKLHHLPATLLRMENLETIGLNCCCEELQRRDVCELKQILDVRHIHELNHDSIPSLLELTLRKIYPLLHSITDVTTSSLLLPSHVTNLLTAPIGHCFHCCSPYFTAVFPLVECAATGLQVVEPSSDKLQRLHDTGFSFVFCCCSKSCLEQVCRMRDNSVR